MGNRFSSTSWTLSERPASGWTPLRFLRERSPSISTSISSRFRWTSRPGRSWFANMRYPRHPLSCSSTPRGASSTAPSGSFPRTGSCATWKWGGRWFSSGPGATPRPRTSSIPWLAAILVAALLRRRSTTGGSPGTRYRETTPTGKSPRANWPNVFPAPTGPFELSRRSMKRSEAKGSDGRF